MKPFPTRFFRLSFFLLFFVLGCEKGNEIQTIIYSEKTTYSEGDKCILKVYNASVDGKDITDYNISWSYPRAGSFQNSSYSSGENILEIPRITRMDQGKYTAIITDDSYKEISRATIDLVVVPFNDTAPCYLTDNQFIEDSDILDGNPPQNTFDYVTLYGTDKFSSNYVDARFFNNTNKVYIYFHYNDFVAGDINPGKYLTAHDNGADFPSEGEVFISYTVGSYYGYMTTYENIDGDVYVTEENGVKYITFCELKFPSPQNPSYSKTLSGRIKLD